MDLNHIDNLREEEEKVIEEGIRLLQQMLGEQIQEYHILESIA